MVFIPFFILICLVLILGLVFFYSQKNYLSAYVPKEAIFHLHFQDKPFVNDDFVKKELASLIQAPFLESANFQELSWIIIEPEKEKNIESFLNSPDEISSPLFKEIIIIRGKDNYSYPDNYFKKQLRKDIVALSKFIENFDYLSLETSSPKKTLDPLEGFIKIEGKTYPLSFDLSQGKIKFQSQEEKELEQGFAPEISLMRFVLPQENGLVYFNNNNFPLPNLIYKVNEFFLIIYPTKENIFEIQARISSFLAKKYPQKKEVILPDKTTAYELIANPQIFQFENCLEEGYCLKTEISPLEIGLKKEGDYLLIANNLDFFKKTLENVYSQEQISLLNNIKTTAFDCLTKKEKSPTLLWFKKIKPLKYILANQSQNFIKGCIITEK